MRGLCHLALAFRGLTSAGQPSPPVARGDIPPGTCRGELAPRSQTRGRRAREAAFRPTVNRALHAPALALRAAGLTAGSGWREGWRQPWDCCVGLERAKRVAQRSRVRPRNRRARQPCCAGCPGKSAGPLRASIYLGLPIVALLACAFAIFAVAIPDPIQLRHKQSSPFVRVLARDGSLLGSRGGERLLRADRFSAPAPDRCGHRHRGSALLRALGRRPDGLSCAPCSPICASGGWCKAARRISQQLAKNLFLGPERTLSRKLGSWCWRCGSSSASASATFSSSTSIASTSARGAYGIEAAAHRFFDKPAQTLTLAEVGGARRPAQGAIAVLARYQSHAGPRREPAACWPRWWRRDASIAARGRAGGAHAGPLCRHGQAAQQSGRRLRRRRRPRASAAADRRDRPRRI